MILGIAVNPYAKNVSNSLIEEAKRLSITIRTIDLPSLTVMFDGKNEAIVRDKDGDIHITCLAPYLPWGFPVAVNAFGILAKKVYAQNPVESVLIADDKAATAERLTYASIPQLPTYLCPSNHEYILPIAKKIGYPVVLKRTHGAQGYWVRQADNQNSLRHAYEDVMREGPGTLILQPQVIESKGVCIRAIVTGGKLLAVTKRIAKNGEWRSNIANGSSQSPIELTANEREMALAAAKTIGLHHAGIDLLPTSKGLVVLEINSCPDFTSMLPYFEKNLTEFVIKASLTPSENK